MKGRNGSVLSGFYTAKIFYGVGALHLESQVATALDHDGVPIHTDTFISGVSQYFQKFTPAAADVQDDESPPCLGHSFEARQVNCLAALDVFTGATEDIFEISLLGGV
jgi:hypothetical protein